MFQAECNLSPSITSMLLSIDHHLQTGRPVTDTRIAATVAAIEAACDHRWAVWRTDTGTWWATRTQALTSAQLTAGSVPFLRADTADDLTERIRQQDRLTPEDRDTAP
jgi:hypothetical protein